MIEALLFTLELAFTMLLIFLVDRAGRPGQPPSLGLFSYRDNTSQPIEPRKTRKRRRHA